MALAAAHSPLQVRQRLLELPIPQARTATQLLTPREAETLRGDLGGGPANEWNLKCHFTPTSSPKPESKQ